ncbi:MAG: LuxR C-terminal-related transcriptional regulator, partial [Flavobacteriales bacterium]|nr:LuxR C-terminal-related transcriptional regulator [Flavobacteriales bacterium]
RSREDVLSRITEREMEFLKLVCKKDELTYVLIAYRMVITKRTVDYYRQELFEKFEIKSKVGLVLFAIEHKLL